METKRTIVLYEPPKLEVMNFKTVHLLCLSGRWGEDYDREDDDDFIED